MPMKQKRRIIQLGRSRVIALPKGWLEYRDLKKGDEVEIVIDEELTIRPAKKQRKSRSGKQLEQRNNSERRET